MEWKHFKLNLRFILGNILIIQLYLLKNCYFFKFKRYVLFFDDFFIFIIVRCIWKVYLFGNILNFEIIALAKK